MLRSNETEIRLTPSMKAKIRNYANHGGGIYRMNTSGANYYSFTPYEDQKGKTDFCGGFDWKHTISAHFSYVYDIVNNKFYKTDVFIKNPCPVS